MLIIAIGFGLAAPTMVIAGTSGVSNSEQGLASGLINTTRQVGAGIGLAITVAISTAQTAALVQSGVVVGNAALVEGFQYAFVACAGFAALAVPVALLVIHEHHCTSKLAHSALTQHGQCTGPLPLDLAVVHADGSAQ